jgi:probable HAF family extracellular repeat protein
MSASALHSCHSWDKVARTTHSVDRKSSWRNEEIMNRKKSVCVRTMALLVALAIPVSLAAQKHPAKHHQYKLVDMGTLGGPQSGVSQFVQSISKKGAVGGGADTSVIDSNYPNSNPFFPFSPDPFIQHAFLWDNGMLTDLGALPGINSSYVLWVNPKGDAVGISTNGMIDPITGYPEGDAVLWKDGQITNLGTLGGNESFANGVNNRDMVVGAAANTVPDPNSFLGFGTQTRAFLWDSDNGMQDLNTLGGTDAFAIVINERGQVMGFSYTNLTSQTIDPFLWEKGTMVDLGTLGGTQGFPNDLNNRGQVVGQSNMAGDLNHHPFLWTKPGPMKDLPTLGGDNGFASWINDDGVAVGRGDLTGSQVHHATVWSHGTVTDLGTVRGDPCSTAYGINSKSQVVGISAICEHTGHAFLWEDGGPMIDLNTVIAPGSGLQLTAAFNINDRGEIAGIGVLSNGDQNGFLLIPCDENDADTEGCSDDAEGTTAVAQNNVAPVTQGAAMVTPHSAVPSETVGRRKHGYRASGGGA